MGRDALSGEPQRRECGAHRRVLPHDGVQSLQQRELAGGHAALAREAGRRRDRRVALRQLAGGEHLGGHLLRGLAAAGVLLSAAGHLVLSLPPNDFKAISTLEPLFLLNGLGGIVLGVLVTSWRHWLPPLGAAGFGATTVIFFWISVNRPLFGFQEPSATGATQMLAQIAEYLQCTIGTVAGLHSRGLARLHQLLPEDILEE